MTTNQNNHDLFSSDWDRRSGIALIIAFIYALIFPARSLGMYIAFGVILVSCSYLLWSDWHYSRKEKRNE